VEAEPDVARVQLRPRADAFLLLGSDGLFDVMSDQEAVDAAAAALAGFNTRPSSELRSRSCTIPPLAAAQGHSANLHQPFFVGEKHVDGQSRPAAAACTHSSAPAGQAAEAAADALVSKALKGGTSDNVTALLMLFDWA
jgi:serine/threonine protein phosphatase PrpC